MNIAKILISVPKGTKLYSPLFGEVELANVRATKKITDNDPIVVKTSDGTESSFDEYGCYFSCYKDAECMLFPSRDCRDWSAFKPAVELKPFDRVLVRDNEGEHWKAQLFSNIRVGTDVTYRYQCIGNVYVECIPYAGNERLLGTTDNP